MKARGKREARRPWSSIQKRGQGLKGRNKRNRIRPFSALYEFLIVITGDALRFASCLPLASIFRVLALTSKHFLTKFHLAEIRKRV